MRRRVEVLVVSRQDCRDSIVRELNRVELYLSAFLRGIVRVTSACVCAEDAGAGAVSGVGDGEPVPPDVYVDGEPVADPSLSTVIDAIQAAALRQTAALAAKA